MFCVIVVDTSARARSPAPWPQLRFKETAVVDLRQAVDHRQLLEDGEAGQELFPRGDGAADRAKPDAQLHPVDRLDDVLVGACVVAAQLLLLRAGGAEDGHVAVRVAAVAFDLAAEVEPVAVRKHAGDDGDVPRVLAEQHQASGEVGGVDDDVAAGGHDRRQQAVHRRVVVDDGEHERGIGHGRNDVHATTPPGLPAA
jgi:hypothetical protein